MQAIEAIYRVLKWVFQNAARIFTLIETIVNGLADIVAGNVGGFAKAVEKGLAMLIPPVLGFIADYFSLGDLPKTVAEHIKGLQKWVLGMIEQAFDWVIAKGKQLLAALGIGKKEEKKRTRAIPSWRSARNHFQAGGEAHRVWIEVSGSNATVMVASEPQGVKEFLNSKVVKSAEKKNPKLSGLVGKADGLLKTVDMSADQLVNQLEAVKEDKAKDTSHQSTKVTSLERQLAECLHDILEILAKKPEPIAGLHGYLKQVSRKDEQEFRHVPAKALGSAIAHFLEDIGGKLKKKPWSEHKRPPAS